MTEYTMTEYTMTEYTMTDAMTERLPPYNFSVSGLVSTDHVLPLIQGLISHISSCIGSDDVDLKSIVVRHPNDVPEALVSSLAVLARDRITFAD